LEFGGIWWRDIKNHRDYEVIKNPATMRVWEPPTGRKGAFAHWILSPLRLPVPPLRQGVDIKYSKSPMLCQYGFSGRVYVIEWLPRCQRRHRE